jgi:hypothetical protein
VTPAAPPADLDQSKLVYDRVGEVPAGTTLVKPPTQVASLPAAEAGQTSAIASVIAGSGAGGPGLASAEPTEALANEPRRVRTVVVKPDGTIVSSEAADAAPATSATAPAAGPAIVGSAAPAPGAPTQVAPTPAASQTAAVSPTPAPAVRQVGPPAVAAPPRPSPTPSAAPRSTNETLNVAGPGAGNTPNGELLITPSGALPSAPAPSPSRPSTGTATAAASTAAPAGRAPAAAAPTTTGSIAAVAPTRPATGQASTAAAAGAPQTTALASAPGATMVQVSSQRTEEGARTTFKDLQTRYAGILGRYEANIQRADLGSRGVFYRARVGPFPLSDARRLCDDLKAAGGDCLLVAVN